MGADAETLNQWTPAPALEPTATEADKVMECGCRFGKVGPVNEACERHREPVASAVAEGWEPLGNGAHRWTSPCGRATVNVWFSAHDNGWRYKVDSPGWDADTAGLWVLDAACGRDLAVKVARERLAKLGDVPTVAKPDASKWHPIAESIAATVAEKNVAYGDSFARSGDILATLYPNGITREQYPDALAVVRVIDKLFRIATDRDALGESPWRDIAGYALLACERAGK